MKFKIDSKTVLGVAKIVFAVGGLIVAHKIEENNRKEDKEELKKELIEELSQDTMES